MAMATAAHTHAAAGGSLNFSITKPKRSDPLVFINESGITYDGNTLVNIRRGRAMIGLSAADLETISALGISRSDNQNIWTRRHRKRCGRPRKRGKRAGIRVKLRRLGPKAVPLPSLLLANVRSQDNKMDEIRLRLTQQRETRNSGALIFTETWIHNNRIRL